MSNWWAVARSSIARTNGKLYLPYHYENVKHHIMMNDAIYQQILDNQLSLFTSRFNTSNKLSPGTISNQEIEAILKDWTMDGTVGSAVARELNEGINGYATSGGIMIGDTGVALSSAQSTFGGSAKKIVEMADKICNSVDSAVGNIINTLAANKENLLAGALLNAYTQNINGGMLPEWCAKDIPNDILLTQGVLSAGDKKMVSLMSTISENLNILTSLPGAQKTGASATNIKESYRTAISAIKASFNALGGQMHELAVLHGINVAFTKADDLVNDFNKSLPAILGSVGTVQVEWVGENKDPVTGQDLKNDINIIYNTDRVSFSFGGNIKLRQSEAFRLGKGRNSEALGVSGFVARQENYESLAKKLEAYSGGIEQAGYDAVGAWDSGEAIASSWNAMKQAMGALTLVDSIAGKGEKGDFSALLVINNKIFSIYDILKKNLTNAGKTADGKHKFFSVQGLDFGKIQSDIKGKSQDSNFYKEAYKRNKNTYAILAKQKISITVNLGFLYGTDIF